MREDVKKRAKKIAGYMIEKKCTVREAAKKFGVSKSTVHKDVTERLIEIDIKLARKMQKLLEHNKEERHIRGGMATKRKYGH